MLLGTWECENDESIIKYIFQEKGKGSAKTKEFDSCDMEWKTDGDELTITITVSILGQSSSKTTSFTYKIDEKTLTLDGKDKEGNDKHVILVRKNSLNQSDHSTSDNIDLPEINPRSKYASIPVGGYITLGTYEQDNNISNGKEDIEWLVLAKETDKMLVISKYGIDCKPYNEEWEDVTWETCTLRTWLNDEFYNTAFSSKEQKKIAETKVVNDDNPISGAKGGNDTKDKVFLLSMDETLEYLKLTKNAGEK